MDEARDLGHASIGTEHLLLGLIREERGLAARVLAAVGITAAATRARLVPGDKNYGRSGAVQMPFEPAAKEALERSQAAADELGHRVVGTEHVLLGLCALNESAAARVLDELGAAAEQIRGEVLRLLSGERT